MRENQVSNQTSSSMFQKKIDQLREKILKMDGVSAVDGISDDLKNDFAPQTRLVQTNIEKG